MTNAEVLEIIGGMTPVRDYLRGIEEGSEADWDAHRAILAAIGSARAAGVYPAMAVAEPEQYAQYVLLLCRLWTDAEDQRADAIGRQAAGLCLQLRYDPRNTDVDPEPPAPEPPDPEDPEDPEDPDDPEENENNG